MTDPIYSNGIDLDTGDYAVPPLSVEELDATIRGDEPPDNLSELERRANKAKHLGVEEGVNVKDLSAAGWGVIFGEDVNPEVAKALQPLLQLREQRAGKRFQRYSFHAGDTKDRFLATHGAGPGPADPDRVPYYLLIVGSPEKIPFSFKDWHFSGTILAG